MHLNADVVARARIRIRGRRADRHSLRNRQCNELLLSFTSDRCGRHDGATSRLEAAATAPLAYQVAVQAKRQSHPGERHARLVASRKDPRMRCALCRR